MLPVLERSHSFAVDPRRLVHLDTMPPKGDIDVVVIVGKVSRVAKFVTNSTVDET